MKILLLGGTADARRLCDRLITQNLDVIYSIAGLVRTPDLDCEILVGGFTQFGGLTQYVKENGIELILDVTHPYAQKMSDQAVVTAKETEVPVWRFHRPAWVATDKDDWQFYRNFDELVALLEKYSCPLLSAGQLSLEALMCLHEQDNLKKLVWRTAVPPKFCYEKLTKLHWVKAIGPFLYQDEKILIQTQDIDVIVSKNSGGSSTSAKLQVAQDMGLKVLILERPILLEPNREFDSLIECADAIMQSRIKPR
ncbi:precorrin-6x reductase [Marinomonas sp. SBI22]|uniref:precorrin-6A/cobalt-precorrin-6A reductase n=1 Tax=unclassified Marinomonas TaxID=196814 RepID=UPI0007AF2673|nr:MULTISPECIES: precorrin-6A/cobalt-precorrin-6A reductase [unclassified Marinomonas]KZM44316.1 precorrin-6x reductase [Marinomonas sp. SBI22]KZM45474.1 precorrin-6x reductase [Marinomonas sp. SBI8L]